MPRTLADLEAAEDRFHKSLDQLQATSQELAHSETTSLDAIAKFNADKLAKEEALAATREALAEVNACVMELYDKPQGEQSPDVRQ